MEKDDLGSFLHGASKKSNAEIADSIRNVKKISNEHDNVVVYQEKRTIKNLSEKLIKSVKCFDEKAEVIIKTKNAKWKQNN